MKRTGAKTELKIQSREDGFKDWEARYAAKIRAYERMAEKREDKRRAKEGERRAQARRDRELAIQDAYDRKYIENSDPFVGAALLCDDSTERGDPCCSVWTSLQRIDECGQRVVRLCFCTIDAMGRNEINQPHRDACDAAITLRT